MPAQTSDGIPFQKLVTGATFRKNKNSFLNHSKSERILPMKLHLRKRSGNGLHRNSRLNFKQLERRNLLAGDVLATVNGAVLEIVGDELANQIQISSVDDLVTVEGLDTSVNGSNEPVSISQPFQHLSLIHI